MTSEPVRARDKPWLGIERADYRLALWLCGPALLAIGVTTIFPLLYTFWESFHLHDLRMPWRGRPFIGLTNYREALSDSRFWGALAHTGFFTVFTVSFELVLGLFLGLMLHASVRGRGLARTIALLPWAMPTVVAGLMWRFLFEPDGAVDVVLRASGLLSDKPSWLGDARLAWVPVVLADVWKTTPFVALLLLAGRSGIDETLYEAARVDGAGPFSMLWHITLPGLRPALFVALIFRTLDAFRIFDLIFVLTSGGPGTATEPLVMYSFVSLMRNLRFGYGSALAVIVFLITVVVAGVYLHFVRDTLLGDRR